MRRRPLLAVPAAVLGTALVTACSGGSGKTVLEQDFGAALRASVEKAGDTSSKVAVRIRTESSGQTVDVTGDGAFAGKEGSLTMTVSGITLQERLTGGKLYLQVPGQPGWYVLDLADLVGSPLAESANPQDTSKVLLAADEDVTKVGTEQVRGADATHYKGTIALDAEHLAKLGGIAKSAVQKLVEGGLTAIPFDAWLDDDGRLVKLVEDVNVTVKGTPAHVVTTVERYDFGTEVSVTAPPVGEQKDGAPLLQAFKNAG